MGKIENIQSFHTRIAFINDIDKLVSLVNRAYRGEAARRAWTTEAELIAGQRIDAEMMRELVTAPESSVLVVEEEQDQGRVLVGCVHVRKDAAQDQWGPRGYFGLLTVEVEQQCRGLGDLLLAKAEEYAREKWDAGAMRMYVISIRQTLIEWYQRRGYQLTGERAPFPYGEKRFGTPLRDDLEFIIMEKPLKRLRDGKALGL